jgi:hypothetical protein
VAARRQRFLVAPPRFAHLGETGLDQAFDQGHGQPFVHLKPQRALRRDERLDGVGVLSPHGIRHWIQAHVLLPAGAVQQRPPIELVAEDAVASRLDRVWGEGADRGTQLLQRRTGRRGHGRQVRTHLGRIGRGYGTGSTRTAVP